jgi:endoribonuclease Dicer
MEACLLVFDECHHAKGGHVFLRIMTEFYRDMDPDDRPRVFGMTASPVDAKVDVRNAAQALEAAMDGEIRTTRNLSLLRAGVATPVERVMYYNPPVHTEVTELHSKLHRQFGSLDISLKKIFLFAKEAAVTLGIYVSASFSL